MKDKEKLIKIAKDMDQTVRIVQIVTYIMGGLMIFVGMLVLANSSPSADSLSFGFGLIRVEFMESAISNSSAIMGSYEFLILTSLLIIVFFGYGTRVLRKILEPMKEGRPFEAQCSKGIRKLATFWVIAGAAFEVGRNLIHYRNFRIYDMASMFSPEKVSEVTFAFQINFNFLLVAGVLYLLSYVFKYGEVLQRESDETL